MALHCNHKCMECMHYEIGKDGELHCKYDEDNDS